jgi:predicted dienelactone hydrolase
MLAGQHRSSVMEQQSVTLQDTGRNLGYVPLEWWGTWSGLSAVETQLAQLTKSTPTRNKRTS